MNQQQLNEKIKEIEAKGGDDAAGGVKSFV